MLKKIIITVVAAAVVIAIFLGGSFLYDMAQYKKIIAGIEIRTPDISSIQNGVYNGFFDAVVVSADVDVTVQDHMITRIVINKHKTDRGASAEAITEDVIIQQSLEVDTVSGATNSSKVILKAIENALANGEK